MYHLGFVVAPSALLVSLQHRAGPSYSPPVKQVLIQAPLCTTPTPSDRGERGGRGRIRWR